MKMLIPLLVVCLSGCQFSPSGKDATDGTPTDGATTAARAANTVATYQPQRGTLHLATAVANPELTHVTLLNDKQTDSLAAATPHDGRFTLTVSDLPQQEVYFLQLTGRSVRRGTSGLEWTEHIPVFFEDEQTTLQLTQQPFTHPGSISGALFTIDGGSDEQDLLNRWQTARTKQQADADGQAVGATLGQSGYAGSGSGPVTAADRRALTQQYIQPDSPSVAALFLAYAGNDHRKQVASYSKLYEAAPTAMRQTKYGVDLARRLERIQHPVEKLDLESR